MADLGTNVRYIKGIGEARAAALEKLGITTLGDLIAYFPRGYEDRTQVRPIRELTAGESVCVRGMVAADLTAYRISGGRTIAKTRVVDDSGSLDLVFFNMEHRRDAMPAHSTLRRAWQGASRPGGNVEINLNNGFALRGEG